MNVKSAKAAQKRQTKFIKEGKRDNQEYGKSLVQLFQQISGELRELGVLKPSDSKETEAAREPD